jgi:CHASE3 domain sensor protein
VRKKGLFAAAAAFAASPQGQRLMRQAKDYVQSPEGRAKLAQLKDQFAQRKGAQTRTPARPDTTPH